MALEDQPDKIIAERMLWIYPPILFIVGVVGNCLFVMVLMRSSSRRTSISLLLTLLACSDTLILTFNVLKKWLAKFLDTDLRATSNIYCKVDAFLTYFLLQLSPWILVLVTVERTYSILYPHKVTNKFTRKRILVAFCLTCLFLVAMNSHIFFVVHLSSYGIEPICIVQEQHMDFFFRIWPWIDMCILFFIPVCFMLIGNIIIIFKLKSSGRFRASSVTRSSSSDSASMRDNMNKHVSSFTKTTVLLNTCFTLLELPSVVFGIGQPYWYPRETATEAKQAQLTLISTCAYMAMYTYNAINFVLYMFCGSKLRNEFLRMVGMQTKRFMFTVNDTSGCSRTKSTNRGSQISNNGSDSNSV